MAWNDLKAAVAAVIKTNGNQEITGALLQSTLNSIIDQVGANATLKGVAIPSTTPGVPDGPVFYLAVEKGVYSNFGGFVHDGGIAILSNSTGSWIGTELLKDAMEGMVVGELGTSETKVINQKKISNELKPSTWRDKGTMSPQYKAAIEELLSMFDFTNSNDFTISDDKGNVIFKIDADGVKLSTKWTGKKIGWYGGSNLKGGNDNISYVNYATERVGALYYNYALGGATQKLFMSDGTPMPKSRRIKAFSILLSEIDTLLSDATEAEKAIAIAQSFETTLIPHANEYDLFMFGYGLNDCEVDKTGSDSWLLSSEFVKFDPLDAKNPDKFPIFSRDRSSYIGATNYVIDRLLEANPRARFGFMGHFSQDDAQYFSTQHERLTIIQNSLSEYWGVGICRPYERTGWICKDGINTISEFCPDDIHAYEDPSGQALEILVKITIDFLLNECTEIF